MPTLFIDSRFHPDAAELSIHKLKKNVRADFVKKFGDGYEIKQQVITHGRPTQGMPDLKDGAFVIRTSTEVTDADAVKIKQKLAQQ